MGADNPYWNGNPLTSWFGPLMTKAEAKASRLEWRNKRPRKLKKKLKKQGNATLPQNLP